MLILSSMTLYCSKALRRKVPINYWILLVVTVFEAVYVAGFASLFTGGSVLMVIGVLAATVACLFVTAYFTPMSEHLLKFLVVGLIISFALQLMFFIMLLFIGQISSVFMIVYACLGVVASGIFVLVDLIVVMKPGAMDMDDYILGALNLYLDIVRMFVYLLMLLGKRR